MRKWPTRLSACGGFNGTDTPGLKYSDCLPDENGNVRNRYGKSVDDLWAEFYKRDPEALAKAVLNASQHWTMRRNIARDPSKPRYARVPHGSKTCAFCLMLASRGFVYWSEKSAGGFGNRYHPGDDCTPVPSWGQCHLDGYSPLEMLKQWNAAKKMTSKQDVADMKASLPAEKRNQAASRAVMKNLRAFGYDVVTDYAVDLPSIGVRALSDKIKRHILIGEGDGKRGGHSAHADVPGKSHFPADWPDDKIIWAVQYACYKPDKIVAGKFKEKQLRIKSIDGVTIQVPLVYKSSRGTWQVVTAYPIGDE